MMFNVCLYELMVLTPELLTVTQDYPEAQDASFIYIGETFIQGPQVLMVATSVGAIKTELPNIIRQLPDPNNKIVRVIRRRGWCSECTNPNQRCPHLGQTIITLTSVFTIKPDRYLKATQK